MFCENVVTLVGWIYKNYNTFDLFNMYCSSLFLFFIFYFYFFLVIDLYSFFYSIFALFIYSSILVSHFVFFFFLVFCLYFFFPFIYITLHTVFLHCERTVVVIVLWFHESSPFFFLFNSRFVYFFSFKYWCKLTFILLYWHNKFHNNFTIIEVLISYKSK